MTENTSTTNGGYSLAPQATCPSCGHCPTCGRGGHTVPVYPQPTWYYPAYTWPQTWCGNAGTSAQITY